MPTMGKKIGKLGVLLTDHKRDPKLERIDAALAYAFVVGVLVFALYGLVLQ